MKTQSFQYLYGPVYSWRLGYSLGIDPLGNKSKVCNFDCIYCQLGRTSRLITHRKEFVSTEAILQEIIHLPEVHINYLTFSGRGEPTLAKNLGRMIEAIREVRPEKIAVITNSALIHRKDVQDDLRLSDFVLAKLDAASSSGFSAMDHAAQNIEIDRIVDGLKSFRDSFLGKFALQIMFIERNKGEAEQIARLAREIAPDEVQLNTPTRPCPVGSLSREEMNEIKALFADMPAVCVYDSFVPETEPLDERATIARHGNYRLSDLILQAQLMQQEQ